jgi:hypothetical protein
MVTLCIGRSGTHRVIFTCQIPGWRRTILPAPHRTLLAHGSGDIAKRCRLLSQDHEYYLDVY